MQRSFHHSNRYSRPNFANREQPTKPFRRAVFQSRYDGDIFDLQINLGMIELLDKTIRYWKKHNDKPLSAEFQKFQEFILEFAVKQEEEINSKSFYEEQKLQVRIKFAIVDALESVITYYRESADNEVPPPLHELHLRLGNYLSDNDPNADSDEDQVKIDRNHFRNRAKFILSPVGEDVQLKMNVGMAELIGDVIEFYRCNGVENQQIPAPLHELQKQLDEFVDDFDNDDEDEDDDMDDEEFNHHQKTA